MKSYNRDYIFAEADDGVRLMLQHEVYKPSVHRIFERVLDEYKLAELLEKAKSSGERLRVLDFGCGEGLYLHDLAALLEARGLLEAAELNGIDINPSAVTTAEQFSKLSKPPRPYLNFYLHDGTRPLEDCQGLRLAGEARFDFIFAIMVIEHMAEARRQVERLYEALKPSGVLYLRDIVLEEGPEGWIAPHPVWNVFRQAFWSSVPSVKEGLEVATEQAEWLREAGAQQVAALRDVIPLGGESDRGQKMLRNYILIIRNSGPRLVSRGLLTQAQYDEILNTLFRELTRQSVGQAGFVDTLACKPG